MLFNKVKKRKNRKGRILVTGGAGFVGSRIVQKLLNQGYEVIVLDNLTRGFRQAVPKGAKFIKGDVRSKVDLKRAMKGIDKVIHCAALLVIPNSFKNPDLFAEVNVVGTSNLLEVMNDFGVKYLVFSSSAGVYAEDSVSPISEDAKKLPYSPYGDTKLAMEYVMHGFYQAKGFHITILRYFNPYGPGYLDNPPKHVVPIFFKKALANQYLPVYGDGDMERDYIYIDDLVDAHLLAMKQKGFNIYNVGAGKGVKIIDLVQEIIKVTGSKSKIKHVKIPPGYPPKMYADISKIKRELGWQPQVSLQEGILKTYEEFYKYRQ